MYSAKSHVEIDIGYRHTSVAAHVQAETMPEAISPGFTEREADENSSEFLGEKPVYRACIAVKPTMKALKNNPIPRSIQTTGKIWICKCLTDD